jgi:hypothetical protein
MYFYYKQAFLPVKKEVGAVGRESGTAHVRAGIYDTYVSYIAYMYIWTSLEASEVRGVNIYAYM